MADNPFVLYRTRLDSYRSALAKGWTDRQFVDLVERLDDQVAQVWGRGFGVTPIAESPDLATALGVSAHLWVKNDTGNVSGSHKSRHLFGVALALAIEGPSKGDLAIASCGNAAIAAAIIAQAVGRSLRVFIPTWADQAIRRQLETYGALITECPRIQGEVGDPAYLRFIEAVQTSATPFSVQSTATPSTLDGGRTMGWELADQLIAHDVRGRVDVFLQIGGGALATSTWQGLTEGLDRTLVRPVLHGVQTEACAPLVRAWEELTETSSDPEDLVMLARAEPDRYMRVWEEVGLSAASGILDDITYDWLGIIDGMAKSGGWPVLVSEEAVITAHARAHEATGIDVEPTGTAGLSALLDGDAPSDQLVVFFTGVTRR